MHGFMRKTHKKPAITPKYVRPAQLPPEGFETPFERSLNPQNRPCHPDLAFSRSVCIFTEIKPGL